MKNGLLLVSFLLAIQLINAQNIGIGTNTPNASAMVEINSNNKGLLLPRLTDTSSVPSPVKGLTIYNNKDNKLWYHDGARWQQAMASGGGMDSIWFKAKDSIAYTARKFVGVNTVVDYFQPQANLQVNGSLLIQESMTYSNSNPTAGQVYIMNNTATNTKIGDADSVLTILDPGGTGNYNNNMQGNYYVINNSLNGQVGIKVSSVAADFGIGTGDTLWVSPVSYPNCRTNSFYRFTNTTTNPADFLLSAGTNYFIFRSNADGNNNKGFNFRITRMFTTSVVGSFPRLMGNGLYYNSARNSFSVGQGTTASIDAVALGSYSEADAYSYVIGNNSKTTDWYSFAIGNNAESRTSNSFSIGSQSIAGANPGSTNCYAIGYGAYADGLNATAIGYYADAEGEEAFAAGNYARARNWGAIALGGGTADGTFSLVVGSGTASGSSSTVIGEGSAESTSSYAMGVGTIARGYGTTVIGRYNHPVYASPQTNMVSTTPILIVGNGDDNGSRSNAFTVLKDGNVGIGITIPSASRLAVNDASGTTIELQANAVEKGFVQLSGNNIRMGCFSSNPTGNIIFRSNGGDQMTIFPSGNATLNGTLTQSSDIRFKENIQPLENALEKLLQLNGYRYNWKPELKKDSALQIGLIAQNVEKVFPELVSTNEEGMKSVAYQNLVPVLIEAIKEQQQQLKAQQKRIEELEKKMNKEKQ
jgi:hypothetical protein